MPIIPVECTFTAAGVVQVRRVFFEGQWQPATQGRQWVDEQGRHVLVMFGDRPAQRLWLRKDTLNWVLVPATAGPPTAVV